MKKLFYYCLTLFFIFWAVPLYYIYSNDKNHVHKITKTAHNYGVVFGAAIRSHNRLSPTLQRRVDDAIYLYKKHKIQKIIFSGSYYNQIFPGEPKAMKIYALKKGVAEQDIVLDERGENTYLTIQFTKYLQEETKTTAHFIYISSFYHIPRIRLLAHMIGINNIHVFYRHKFYTFTPFIARESLALWCYLAYYPFFKLAHIVKIN